jgi:hypothetical protein
MQMGVEYFLSCDRADVGAEIETANAGVLAHDLLAQMLGDLVHGLPLIKRRLENIDGMALRQYQAVQRPHGKFIADRESQLILSDWRKRRQIAERTSSLPHCFCSLKTRGNA